MKFTALQKGWLILLMALNPIFTAGAMSMIAEYHQEKFTDIGNFLIGLYTILWIIILVSYLIKKDKWIKEFKPKTPDQIVNECWDKYRKEKEVENGNRKM